MTQSLDHTFFALSDPTRRAIIARLAQGEATVGELADPFEISAPAISKHLRVLERAGLVQQERVGKTRRCRLNPEPLGDAADFIESHRKFWEMQFDRLADFLEESSRASSRRRKDKKR